MRAKLSLSKPEPGRRTGAIVIALVLALAHAPLLAADTEVQDLHFDSNGVKIRYTDQGAGEPVVLVHGFTASVEANWGSPGVIATLAPHYRVIAMDARGHGKSGKPHDPAAYGFNMVEDVIRLMDHLGILKAHLAGYSMGGSIALQAMATYPDRFYSVILGGSGWTPPAAAGAMQGMMTALADSLEQGKGLGPLIRGLNPTGAPPPTEEQIAAANQMLLATNDPLALAAVIRGMANSRQIHAEQMKASRVPVLAVIGEIDPIKASVDAMQGVASHLEVVVLPGRDHLSAVADPKLASSMLEFLQKH